MRVTFILPGAGRVPIGGLKIVYEYANRLANRGHSITLVHTACVDKLASSKQYISAMTRYLKRTIRSDYGPCEWFKLDPEVRIIWTYRPTSHAVPEGDAVIATSWQTAEWVADYSSKKGVPLYFLQHKETWSGPEQRVMATWRLPLKKIVISRWLERIATDLGEKATYIPNGLDFDAFGLDIPMQERNPYKVMMLYHHNKWKGSKDGLEALSIVHESLPEMKAVLFGVPEIVSHKPAWVEYYNQPEPSILRRLYNQAAVFLAPSWSEGWGLPASEAMMCGTAVVATDIGGHDEFALTGRTALMAPPHDPKELARQILRLCTDDDHRFRIAMNGHAYIQQFTWERAVQAFESVLLLQAGARL